VCRETQHLRLLRARRERPRGRRAAEKRDKLAPSNVTLAAPAKAPPTYRRGEGAK
jgi:hypothetical protein